MRVVLDANQLVSAVLVPVGRPAQVLIEIVTPALFIERVLAQVGQEG